MSFNNLSMEKILKIAGVDSTTGNPTPLNENEEKCRDCGSTLVGHHTKLCEAANKDDIRDLPAKPLTQRWTGEMPK